LIFLSKPAKGILYQSNQLEVQWNQLDFFKVPDGGSRFIPSDKMQQRSRLFGCVANRGKLPLLKKKFINRHKKHERIRP
jgi:hypothetical protein